MNDELGVWASTFVEVVLALAGVAIIAGVVWLGLDAAGWV